MVQCAHNKNIPIVWYRAFKNKRIQKSNSPFLTNSTELLSVSSDKLRCVRTCSLVILRFIPRRHIQMKAILTIKFVQLHQAAFITWGHSRKLMQHRVWICNAEQRWVWLLFFWVFFFLVDAWICPIDLDEQIFHMPQLRRDLGRLFYQRVRQRSSARCRRANECKLIEKQQQKPVFV